jgi:hypothetical protein
MKLIKVQPHSMAARFLNFEGPPCVRLKDEASWSGNARNREGIRQAADVQVEEEEVETPIPKEEERELMQG